MSDFNLGPNIKAFPCNPQWWQSWLIFTSVHIQVKNRTGTLATWWRDQTNSSTKWSWASDEDAWILDTANRVNLQASEAHSTNITNITARIRVGQMTRHPNHCNLRQAAGKPVSDTLHCSDRGMIDAWIKLRHYHSLSFQTCDIPTWQYKKNQCSSPTGGDSSSASLALSAVTGRNATRTVLGSCTGNGATNALITILKGKLNSCKPLSYESYK